MKFLFLGAGAIGTYIGGALALSGHDVSYIEQPATAELLNESGFTLTRVGKAEEIVGLPIYGSAAEALADGPFDVAVFAVKSFDTESAIRGLLDTGFEVPNILTLQNGVDNESILASIIGADKVISGTVASAVSKPGIGQVVEEKHRGLGIALGHPLSQSIVEALNDAGLSAKAYESSGSMKWSKLLTNLTGNATSAILDMRVGELFTNNTSYSIEVAVLKECLAVMKAQGFKVVDLPGTPVRALALGAKLPRFIAQPLLTKFLGSGRGDKMPSFHIDLHSGRGQTEVTWLNGAVSRAGADHGIPTPVNDVLTDTLTKLSSGEISIEEFRHNPTKLAVLISGSR